MRLTVNPPIDELVDAIRDIEQNTLGDLTQFWDTTATQLVANEFALVFATEGFGKWPALNPVYAAFKAIEFPFKTILRRTDRYFKAVTDRGADGHFSRITADSLEWGVNLHQFEDAYPERHERGSGVPARPVFAFVAGSESLAEAVTEALFEHLVKEIRSKF